MFYIVQSCVTCNVDAFWEPHHETISSLGEHHSVHLHSPRRSASVTQPGPLMQSRDVVSTRYMRLLPLRHGILFYAKVCFVVVVKEVESIHSKIMIKHVASSVHKPVTELSIIVKFCVPCVTVYTTFLHNW